MRMVFCEGWVLGDKAIIKTDTERLKRFRKKRSPRRNDSVHDGGPRHCRHLNELHGAAGEGRDLRGAGAARGVGPEAKLDLEALLHHGALGRDLELTQREEEVITATITTNEAEAVVKGGDDPSGGRRIPAKKNWKEEGGISSSQSFAYSRQELTRYTRFLASWTFVRALIGEKWGYKEEKMEEDHNYFELTLFIGPTRKSKIQRKLDDTAA